MPDHIHNCIKFDSKQAFDRFIKNYTKEYTEDDGNVYRFVDFSLAIPKPSKEECIHTKYYLKDKKAFMDAGIEYQEGDYLNWYRWQIDNWGTKWNSYENKIDYVNCEVCFNTAYCPPLPVYTAMFRQDETFRRHANIYSIREFDSSFDTVKTVTVGFGTLEASLEPILDSDERRNMAVHILSKYDEYDPNDAIEDSIDKITDELTDLISLISENDKLKSDIPAVEAIKDTLKSISAKLDE